MRLNCGHSNGYKTQGQARDYISAEIFDLVECDRCKLVQTKFNLTDSDISDYYPPAYYGAQQRYNPILTKLVKSLAKNRLNLITDYLPDGAKVLDVGCGQGWLLNELKLKGCQVTGIEVSEQAAYHAKQVLKLDTRIGDARELQLDEDFYDCIIIWHVLEHVNQPSGLLEYACQRLKSNGIILLAVPDYSSIESRISKKGWFHLDAPRHLSHFEKVKLEKEFSLHKLNPIKFSTCVPEYDFFSFIQSMLNRIGLQQNCLYSFLRRNSQGSLMNNRIKKVDLLLSILSLPLLGLAAIVWVPLVTVLGKGATIAYVLRDTKQQDFDKRDHLC